jgi:hypothetical protein
VVYRKQGAREDGVMRRAVQRDSEEWACGCGAPGRFGSQVQNGPRIEIGTMAPRSQSQPRGAGRKLDRLIIRDPGRKVGRVRAGLILMRVGTKIKWKADVRCGGLSHETPIVGQVAVDPAAATKTAHLGAIDVVVDDLTWSLTVDHSEIVMSVKREAAVDRVIPSPSG